MVKLAAAALISVLALSVGPVTAADRFITLASTTSTENSGLFGRVLPIFTAESGIEVRVIALGTGQAIRLASNGDADVLLVHHKASEERLVAEGIGVKRHEVMYNDFVLVGPRTDTAGVTQHSKVRDALARIAKTKSLFASRGDDSGTHKAERRLWQSAGVDPDSASGTWYREMGAGMGATLNAAVAMNAYALVDRATWISFANKSDLAIVNEGDSALFNQYAVILVNSARHSHVKAALGQTFVDWLLSPGGQAAIASFEVDGQQLFVPNAPRR